MRLLVGRLAGRALLRLRCVPGVEFDLLAVDRDRDRLGAAPICCEASI